MGPDTIYGTSQGPDSAISFWEKFKQNTQWEIVLNVWEKRIHAYYPSVFIK